jgi:hypothetical protein
MAVVGVLAVAACPARPGPPDVPAVLVNPTAESRAELARVVSGALNGAPVTLADDALVHDDTLVIERAPHRDASGRPLDGRETGRPEHFRLVRNDTRCVLIQQRTGRRWTLASATCSPR